LAVASVAREMQKQGSKVFLAVYLNFFRAKNMENYEEEVRHARRN